MVPRGGVEPKPLSSGFVVGDVALPVGVAGGVPRTPVFRSRELAPRPVPAVPLVELARAALPLPAPVPDTPLVPAGPVEEEEVLPG